jgi:hypothetical protein
MMLKADLEELINDSYQIAREYRDQFDDLTDPKAKRRAWRGIREQLENIDRYLKDYRKSFGRLPPDIVQKTDKLGTILPPEPRPRVHWPTVVVSGIITCVAAPLVGPVAFWGVFLILTELGLESMVLLVGPLLGIFAGLWYVVYKVLRGFMR